MLTKTEIKKIRSLADKEGRTLHGLFIIEGEKMVREALESRMHVVEIFTTAGDSPVKGSVVVSTNDMQRISSLKTPTPYLATVKIPASALPDNPGGQLSLALDRVQNPGNLGTIIRLADWFGIGDIYCSPDCADCYNPKVIQATMGSIFRVRVHYTELEPLMELSGRNGNPVYGTFLEGKNIYQDHEIEPDRGLILMGNEGSGISPGLARHVSRKLFIPPYPESGGRAESLNVAIATAIICAEFRRR